MLKTAKINSNLILESNASTEDTNINPTLTRMRFIFTDNLPNANKKGIPESAFPNLINSAKMMPIKMALGRIADGHEESFPLGTINDLIPMNDSENPDRKFLLGNAYLWSEERPQDIEWLKSSSSSEDKPNVSWELLYTESSEDENGVEWLKDPIVKASTVVGRPAYKGRTPILQVASEEQAGIDKASLWKATYINNLPDSAFLYIESGGEKDSNGNTLPRDLRHFPYKDKSGKIDRKHLEIASTLIPESNIPESIKSKLQVKTKEILANLNKEGNSTMDELEKAQARITELENKLLSLEKELKDSQVNSEIELNKVNTENSALKEFKAAVEKKEAEAALLNNRLKIFASKNINFTPEEIDVKKALWIKLDDEEFNYLVSELETRTTRQSNSSENKPRVPGIITNNESDDSVKIVREGLKNFGKKN